VAGNSDVGAVRAALARHLKEEGIAYEVHETSAGEKVADVVRPAMERGFDTFVAAGGDGTVSGLADGLVQTGALLGILPVGTVNTLARELGIPLDLHTAARLLAKEHTTVTIDAGRIGEHCFVLNASVGASVAAMRETPAQEKQRLGAFAYFFSGVRALADAQPHSFTIEVDGRRMQLRASEVVVANGAAIGDPVLRWGPTVRANDGQLDLCIVRARSIVDYLTLGLNLLRGYQRQDSRLRCMPFRRSAEIDVDVTMRVQADGEVIGQTPVRIDVVPKAIDVIVPMSRA
jgi:YegS/Rv2252/BmrU family lipid kinase